MAEDRKLTELNRKRTLGESDKTYLVSNGVSYYMTGGDLKSEITKDGVAWGNITGTLSNQSDLNTAITGLQGQIDEFTALTPGSTTGDAELTNIRVAANGTTYSTAGDAVRAMDGQFLTQLNAMKTGFDGVVYPSPAQMVQSCDAKIQREINITNDIVKISPITSGYTEYAGFWKASDGTYYANTSIVTRVISVESNTQYYYTGRNLGSAGYYGIIFFDSNDDVIGGDCISTSTRVDYARYKVMPPTTASKIGFTATKENSANSGNAYLLIEKSEPYNNDNKKHGGSFGFETFPGIEDDVFYHIPIYGQSLSVGADAPYYNDGEVSGLFMLGSLDTPEQNLTPLVLTSGTMNPIVPALHDLKAIADQNGKNHYMVATSSGRGGRSIAQLMSAARQAEIKTARSIDYDIDVDNPLQFEVWKNACTYTKAVIKTRLNRQLKCPIIVFIQGERDFYTDEGLINAGADKPHAYACGDNKAYYKQYMSMIKEDMQSYIMTTYDQTEKPLFAIYPCSGDFVKSTTMGVTMAQQEFADENSDVILLAPHYPMPNYNNGHLTTNGYRWLGEYIGRSLSNALINRTKEKQMECLGGYVIGNKAYLIIDGAFLPIIVDDYTVPQKTNCGFKLYVNGSEATVINVSIQGNLIVLTSNQSMDSATKVEVTYAQNVFDGHGNIRDSAPYIGQFEYLDDSSDTGTSGNLSIVYRPKDKDDNYLTGKPYPMWNWLVPFYKKIVG